MKTYYLQQWEENGRWIIDTTFPQNASSVMRDTTADCWIQAKKNLGFGLTVTQEWMLNEKRRLVA